MGLRRGQNGPGTGTTGAGSWAGKGRQSDCEEQGRARVFVQQKHIWLPRVVKKRARASKGRDGKEGEFRLKPRPEPKAKLAGQSLSETGRCKA
jgi:hypothetical protein